MKKFICAFTITSLITLNHCVINEYADEPVIYEPIQEPVIEEVSPLPIIYEEISKANQYTNIKQYVEVNEFAFKQACEEYQNIYNISDDILMYSETYKINPFFIVSVASLESAYGTSNIAQSKNNYFGLCCYDETPYESAGIYRTPSDSVNHFCNVINNYQYSNINKISQRYCTDTEWASKVSNIMNKYIDNYNAYI